MVDNDKLIRLQGEYIIHLKQSIIYAIALNQNVLDKEKWDEILIKLEAENKRVNELAQKIKYLQQSIEKAT